MPSECQALLHESLDASVLVLKRTIQPCGQKTIRYNEPSSMPSKFLQGSFSMCFSDEGKKEKKVQKVNFMVSQVFCMEPAPVRDLLLF